MPVKNEYIDLDVNDLHVNPENPRMMDGVEDEKEAINYLLDNFPGRMKKIASDIVVKGAVYDPPLVKRDNGILMVHDGNRRVSCLKLIHNPSIAENPSMQRFFEKIHENHGENISTKVNCRVEDDLLVINDILERRHAGGDTGIGQMPWGPNEKENFFIRNGMDHKPRFGTELSRVLREKGILSQDEKIKVSIFDRLFDSEANKNRVGLSFKNGVLSFLNDEAESLAVIKRVVDDTKVGNINLKKAWSVDDKKAYLSHLENEGFLPLTSVPGVSAADDKDAVSKKNASVKKVQRKSSYARPHLIPEGVDFVFSSDNTNARLQNIICELQTDLYFSKHLNAIAVLFRVFIEMSVDNYISVMKLDVSSKGKYGPSLAEKFESCLEHMVSKKILSNEDRRVLIKFKQPEQFLSADTFHAYVHHKLANPQQSDLISMWDSMQGVLVECVNSSGAKAKMAAA